MAVRVNYQTQFQTNLAALSREHSWLDPSSMMAVAQSSRSADEAVAAAEQLRQAKFQTERSYDHAVFDDGRLADQQTLPVGLQRYIVGTAGRVPVAADDPARVQQMLVDNGYSKEPVNGLWSPAWQDAMQRWRDDKLKDFYAGNHPGSTSVDKVWKWIDASMPVKAFDAMIGFVRGMPNDARHLAADVIGVAAGTASDLGLKFGEKGVGEWSSSQTRFEAASQTYNFLGWGPNNMTPQQEAVRWGRDPQAVARGDYTKYGGKDWVWRITQSALSDVGTAFLVGGLESSAGRIGTMAAEEAAATPAEAAARAATGSTRGPGAIAKMLRAPSTEVPLLAHPEVIATAEREFGASSFAAYHPGTIPLTVGEDASAAAQAFVNDPILQSTYRVADGKWGTWYRVRNWAATPYRYAPVRLAGEAYTEGMNFGFKARATAALSGIGPKTESATLAQSIQREHTLDQWNAAIHRNTGVAGWALDLNNTAMLLHTPIQPLGTTAARGHNLQQLARETDHALNEAWGNSGMPQIWEDFGQALQKHLATTHGEDFPRGTYRYEDYVRAVGGESRARRWMSFKFDEFAVQRHAERLLDAAIHEAAVRDEANATLSIYGQDVPTTELLQGTTERANALHYYQQLIGENPDTHTQAWHSEWSQQGRTDFLNWLITDSANHLVAGRGRGPSLETGGPEGQRFYAGVNEYLNASEIMADRVMPALAAARQEIDHVTSGYHGVAMNYSVEENILRDQVNAANSILGDTVRGEQSRLQQFMADTAQESKAADAAQRQAENVAKKATAIKVRSYVNKKITPLVSEYRLARMQHLEAEAAVARVEKSLRSMSGTEFGDVLGPDAKAAYEAKLADLQTTQRQAWSRQRINNWKQAYQEWLAPRLRAREIRWNAENNIDVSMAPYGGTPSQMRPFVTSGERDKYEAFLQSRYADELRRLKNRSMRWSTHWEQQQATFRDAWLNDPENSLIAMRADAQKTRDIAAKRMDKVVERLRKMADRLDLELNLESPRPLGKISELEQAVAQERWVASQEGFAPPMVAPVTPDPNIAQTAMEARWRAADAARQSKEGPDLTGVYRSALPSQERGTASLVPMGQESTQPGQMSLPLIDARFGEAAERVVRAHDSFNAHTRIARDNERAIRELGGMWSAVNGEVTPLNIGIARTTMHDQMQGLEQVNAWRNDYDGFAQRIANGQNADQLVDESLAYTPGMSPAEYETERAAQVRALQEDGAAAQREQTAWEGTVFQYGLTQYGADATHMAGIKRDGMPAVLDYLERRARRLAEPLLFDSTRTPPGLQQAIDDLDAMGYKIVVGRNLGHRFVHEMPMDVVDWHREAGVKRILTNFGLNPKLVADTTITRVQRTNAIRRLQAWMDADPARMRPGMDALDLMGMIDRTKQGQFVSEVGMTRLQRARQGVNALFTPRQGTERAAQMMMSGELMDAAIVNRGAINYAKEGQKFANVVQHRDLNRKVFVEALTNQSIWDSMFGPGYRAYTADQANQVFQQVVKAYADTPFRFAGMTKIDDLFRASMMMAGGNWSRAAVIGGATAGGVVGGIGGAERGTGWEDVAAGAVGGAIVGAAAGAGTRAMSERMQMNIAASVANMPNKLKELVNVSRFELSPMFSFRRLSKTNVKLSLEGIAPTIKPLTRIMEDMVPVAYEVDGQMIKATRNMRRLMRDAKAGIPEAQAAVEQARLRMVTAQETLFRAFPEYRTNAWQVVDDADRYLREQDVFSLYNGTSYETYAAYQLQKRGYTPEQIRESIIHMFAYGKGGQVGRSAIERTANFFFFPLSFDKTLYRNVGMYLLDRPGQIAFMMSALGAYNWFSERYKDTPGASEWVDRHMPLLQEVQRLNAFEHGVGLGEPLGQNAPLFQLFVPQKWKADKNSLDALKRFTPVVKDFQEVYKATHDQGIVLQNASANAMAWMQLATNQDSWTSPVGSYSAPFKSTSAPRYQLADAFAYQRQLYKQFDEAMRYNRKVRNPQDKIVFPAEPTVFGTYAMKPIDAKNIRQMVHDRFPLYDPAKAASLVEQGNIALDQYARQLQATNNPLYGPISQWIANARQYGRYLQSASIEEQAADYAWYRQNSLQLYKQATEFAKQDPEFYRLYQKNFQRSLGALEEAR